MGDVGAGAAGGGVKVIRSHTLFDNFVQASTCKGTLKAFQELCDHLELQPTDSRVFYHKLKSKLNYWKAKALWAKLDKRAGQKEYKKGRACANSKCLIIGAGPCGLRTAIELGFLGAKVVLLEKRDIFSRNNVLHLWPFTIQDLRGLGAKKFYGKFCAGAIDHISIRQLQLMLLKVALLVGIEIHVNVEFKGLIEPPEDQESEKIGWRAEINPRTHPVNELEFDVIIGADGRRNTLAGFARKEFRGKLAIAITANFINRHTTAEASVEEISGVAFIFNQKFFQDLREATGVDLENIVYYKDDTHYFVMTAKKQSLLEKGVILHDYADTEMLLSRANVDQAALLSYACEAADFSTNRQLPALDFAINHYGLPDVAMFDFTCMYASENAALVRQRHGHKLLVALVGDSLLEPFWPMGTGIARGFLAGIDSAWMVRSWAQGNSPLEVLAERESIYRLLPQTTPENVSKNFSHYSVDPTTRYPNVSLNFLRPNQVGPEGTLYLKHVCPFVRFLYPESIARSSKLLNWCQRQTEGYKNVNVTDLTTSWKSGLALCALIHRYRPDLMEYDSLDERNQERNNQLAFDVAEREFGISPCMTGKEMTSVAEPDKLSMVMYISQFYEMFKDTVPPGGEFASVHKSSRHLPIPNDFPPPPPPPPPSQEDQVRTGPDDRPSPSTTLTDRRVDPSAAAGGRDNKVKVMANQLLAKFEENAPEKSTGLKRQVCRGITDHGSGSLRKEFPVNIGGSDVCFFCSKRVYVMERLSAEGRFFHRSCFKCDYCGTTLRLSSYAFDVEDGTFGSQKQSSCSIPPGSPRGHVIASAADRSKRPRPKPPGPRSGRSRSPRSAPRRGPTRRTRSSPRTPPRRTPPPRRPTSSRSSGSRAPRSGRAWASRRWTAAAGSWRRAPTRPPPAPASPPRPRPPPPPPPPPRSRSAPRLCRRSPSGPSSAGSTSPWRSAVFIWLVMSNVLSCSLGLILIAFPLPPPPPPRQIIQRQLEQVEEKQRQLEERGVAVEKALRGEAGMGKKDDPKLMQEWFKLVQEKNALVRYESELMIFARELELEDRQSRLQQDLRERMAVEDHLKTEQELSREKQILNEMLEVVEQRDSLVALLEEQRLREKEEDKDLESVMLSKGFNLNWV
uniref:F-actin monooxygenase n=1 Tax=Gadus morhua TaxID=8049 RepID=A0A8C4Z0S2_GADMO